jgi:hypothetical protein
MLSTLLSWPFLALAAYLAFTGWAFWLLHRRIEQAEQRSVLVNKRVAAIRESYGKIRDSYGDGTVSTNQLASELGELGEQLDATRGELGELANRVRILPAQMARAARGERYDSDDDDDETDELGAAADEVTPEQVAALIAARANGNHAPAAPQPESLEQRVFAMRHGRR